MKFRNLFLSISLICLLQFFSCKEKTEAPSIQESDELAEDELLYRPNFHFTPKANWMNDPNGMFYKDGLYHLYFQYYPDDNVWGPMHWGHAESKDMIKWEQKEIAIYPDSLGYIFSGSAVVDIENTSGLGQIDDPAVIAIFTYHDPVGAEAQRIDFQSQAIAFSLNNGRSFTKFEGNPVLPNPGIKDFRDPKVVWDEERDQWIMALATYEATYFYRSSDLKSWQFLSAFGEGIGAHGGVWECPDFFPMKVENSDEVKWVLLQSLNPGGPNGGSGTQYFIGDFDGTNFSMDPSFQEIVEKEGAVWLDHGRDNYAGVTWSNVPNTDGRKLFMGWMSNWDYAQVVPTETWRSAMTVARELKLFLVADSYQITSYPVDELNNYIVEKSEIESVVVDSELEIDKSDMSNWSSSSLEMTLTDVKDKQVEFVLENESGEQLVFGLNFKEHQMYIDRSQSGDLSFSEKFADSMTTAKIQNSNDDQNLMILLDKTSIEIFLNKGETVMTEIFFPSSPYSKLSLNAPNGSIGIENLKISEVNTNE